VVTMNKIFKLRVDGREIFGFYMDDKNVLFVREGLGCFDSFTIVLVILLSILCFVWFII